MALPARPTKGQVNAFDTFETWGTAVSALAEAALPIKGTLGTADLNSIITPGIYFQSNGANSTLERNYPAQGLAFTVVVLPSAGAPGFVTQEAMVNAGGYVAKGKFARSVISAGSFSPWQFISSQRVDTTAGRAFYKWDHQNNREQLDATSDTGWRQVLNPGDILDMPNLAGFLRRTGYDVTFAIGETAAGTAPAGARTIFTAPTGFRFTSLGPIPSYATGDVVNPGTGALLNSVLKVPSVASAIVQLDVVVGARHAGSVSWKTLDSWPTILPGTAVGNIPNL